VNEQVIPFPLDGKGIFAYKNAKLFLNNAKKIGTQFKKCSHISVFSFGTKLAI